MTHTKGPWEIHGGNTCDFIMGGDKGDSKFVCQLFNREDEDFSDSKTKEANAKLIAAAPEMLELLNSIGQAITSNYGDGVSMHLFMGAILPTIDGVVSKAEDKS